MLIQLHKCIFNQVTNNHFRDFFMLDTRLRMCVYFFIQIWFKEKHIVNYHLKKVLRIFNGTSIRNPKHSPLFGDMLSVSNTCEGQIEIKRSQV